MRAGWQTSCSVLLGCLAFSSLLFYTPSFLSGKTIMKRKLSNVPCWTPCKDEQLVCPSCFSWVTQPCYQVWTRLLTLEKNIAGVLEETIIKTNWFLRVALWISVNNLSSHIPLWVSNLFWFVSILIAYCIIGCQLHLTLWLLGLQSTRLLCPWDFAGKNTGVGCHFLLQGIFPTQGSNPCLLHWQRILYHWTNRR